MKYDPAKWSAHFVLMETSDIKTIFKCIELKVKSKTM